MSADPPDLARVELEHAKLTAYLGTAADAAATRKHVEDLVDDWRGLIQAQTALADERRRRVELVNAGLTRLLTPWGVVLVAVLLAAAIAIAVPSALGPLGAFIAACAAAFRGTGVPTP